MTRCKIITTIGLILMLPFALMAQENYQPNWKKINELEETGLTASALKEVLTIFNKALVAKNYPQQIKAAMYQMKYRNELEEESGFKNILYLDTLIEKTPTPAKNILQNMQAQLLWRYLQNHRYELYDRKAHLNENNKDLRTWDALTFHENITRLFKASLQNEKILQNNPLDEYDAVVEKGKNTRQLRPTLYDFLAFNAFDYFKDDETYITQPSYRFVLNDPAIFSPATVFMHANFYCKDSNSNHYQAILLLQQILQFHFADQNKEAFLDADLIRIEFVTNNSVLSEKEELYETALKQIEKDYTQQAPVAQAMFLRAQLYANNGNRYNPFANQSFQFDLNKSKILCDSILMQYPETEGAVHATNLLFQIKKPHLKIETEKVNIPEQPFRAIVHYKNTPTLFLKLIPVDQVEINNLDRSNQPESWKNLTVRNTLKNWSVPLPDLKDFQEHTTEIKIDALPTGIYILLSSGKADFSLDKNVLTKSLVYISNISYIQNTHDELYVLDRETGQPLEKATVQLWNQNYNGNLNKYELTKSLQFVSDKNGYVKLSKSKTYQQICYQINYQKDELFTDDFFYNYSYSSYDILVANKTFLFTDRSIYRPGQIVYYKGIVIKQESKASETSVVKDYTTSLQLFDANQQQVASQIVHTNEFGSYNGSFTLPAGQINGQFFIKDSVNESMQYFNVEEYKRPTFYTELNKPTGTYKLNDSIVVTGFAKAYAGNNLTGTKVTYRVKREVQYPVWGIAAKSYTNRIAYPTSNESLEITQGETFTDENGLYQFIFKAIPDESIDKNSQPIFFYEVTADITDINGETRSTQSTISVSYQMLQLQIGLPNGMNPDSLHSIKIKSTNLNDVFESTKMTVLIEKLHSPERIFRSRYWETPDQFVMSKEDYYNYFPHDVYASENKVEEWSTENIFLNFTDSAQKDGSIRLPSYKIEPGWYKITATTFDKYGGKVNAKMFFEIINNLPTALSSPIQINIKNKEAQPGEQISYEINTSYDQVWLIQSIIKSKDQIATSYETIKKNASLKNNILVTEDNRGGINLCYAFVKNNRIYSGSESFPVSWKNKKLDITYETFRDKILPGGKEKWKIKIKGDQSDKIAAEALISMYDASLDQFKQHQWNDMQSLWPLLLELVTWTGKNFEEMQSEEKFYEPIEYNTSKEKTYDNLLDNGWSNTEGSHYYLMRGKPALSAAAATPMMDGMDFATNLVDTKKKAATQKEAVENPKKEAADNAGNFSIRKKFNETAFFMPSLYTDENGNIEFSFTAPEALTQWKMMTLSHSKEAMSGYSENTTITQKTLMVQPNVPRFLREGDKIELSVKVVNMDAKEMTGTVQLELFDVLTNRSVDGWCKNIFPVQYFTVAAGQSSVIQFPIEMPVGFNSVLGYRIKAMSKDESFSDGEESALPVLSNRILITESLPINMRKTNRKDFVFLNLLNSDKRESLSHQSITVEYSSNPIWYVVQALPYLMEPSFDCAEQYFNKFYANTLASFICNKNKNIESVFEQWKTKDTSALVSNLEKNESLKSTLLEETPWVLDAKNETTQKKNIAKLFDKNHIQTETNNSITQLIQLQNNSGAFSWFKGGNDDRYMTQYILSGIGHLRSIQAMNDSTYNVLYPLIEKSMLYLDNKINEDYARVLKEPKQMNNNQLSSTAIQYLYLRGFYKDIPVLKDAEKAVAYYTKQAKTYWTKNNRYLQAMIALSLKRFDENKTASAIIKSLKENAIYNEEMGMYWKEFSHGGCYWYQSPIESQALMIEAFSAIDKNESVINDMKTWLLKQKQTQHWKTTRSTAEACYALLLNGSHWLDEKKEVDIELGNTSVKSAENIEEAGTGYFKQTIPGEKVNASMGNVSVKIIPTNNTITSQASWGAVYWQYWEEADKVKAAASNAETALKISKKIFKEKGSDFGPVLVEIKEGETLQPGDKVKVRMIITADRNMEYIHLKDMRAACLEPVNVLSDFKWQGGLGYYETTKDASTNFFFGWLPKGTYVFEYMLFVTHAGNYSNGISTIQGMYAPEFSSNTEGIRVSVEQNDAP